MQSRSRWLTVVLGVVLAGSVVTLHAEDPLKVAPSMYSLVMENDRVRVMQVVFKPGEKIAKHSHPDHLAYVLEAGELKISKPDGSSSSNDLQMGQAVWIPAETHWAENTGTTSVKLLVIELKDDKMKSDSKSKTR